MHLIMWSITRILYVVYDPSVRDQLVLFIPMIYTIYLYLSHIFISTMHLSMWFMYNI